SLTMCQMVRLLLISVIWADLFQETNGYMPAVGKKFDSGCHRPFIDVGNRCYYFGEEELSFNEASQYCEGLSDGSPSLAMFDYSRKEDQDLLNAITARGGTFWIGGKAEDGNQWKWVDGRDVYLKGPFWFDDEPNEVENKCLVGQVHNFANVHTRTYLYNYDCTNSIKFICQSECPIHFRRLGDYCYLTSSALGIPELTWTEARDYCQTLSVYEGFHADLAVLGLPGQDDYYIMQNLITDKDAETWIGGVKKGEECQFEWIDGREIEIYSMFWRNEEPDCGGQDRIALSNHMYTGDTYAHSDRRYIIELGTGSIGYYPFVCQMFKDV
ncbi:unnamed protein product, partial [Meganyctiphanes norvegica]